MDVLLFVCLFYVPSLVLLAYWWMSRHKENWANRVLVSWLLVVAILAIIGAVQFMANSGYKANLMGYIVGTISSVLLSGPWLAIIARARLHPAWAFVGVLVLPFAVFLVGTLLTEALGWSWAL